MADVWKGSPDEQVKLIGRSTEGLPGSVVSKLAMSAWRSVPADLKMVSN